MGSQRIASALINMPFRPPGWGQPTPGEEPGEGEDPGSNPPIEDGYSNLSDGLIVDLQQTLQELLDDPNLSLSIESFNLQSIGEPIEFVECDGSEGEGGFPESTLSSDFCPCEQSLYWATELGYDCANLNLLYFYHPDYLGSVEFVTDMAGDPYQFFLNTPWGENVENQFAKNYTSFSSRFRFNGKEWDDETGNFYYGARYYDPKISVWLSVDPLAQKAPSLTPYRFSFNNPFSFVDPDGLFEGWVKSLETGKYEWDDCAENQGTTAEGYQFIGMEDSDVLEDMGYCETQKSFQDKSLGVFQYQDETTAFSWGVAGSSGVFKSDVDVNISLEVLESDDQKSESNQKGKYIAGVRVTISGSVSSSIDSNPMFSLTGSSISTVEGGEYSNSWVYTRRQKPKSLWPGQQHIINPQSIGVGSTLIPISDLYGGAPINVSVKGHWHVNNVTVGLPSFLGLIFTASFRGNLTF